MEPESNGLRANVARLDERVTNLGADIGRVDGKLATLVERDEERRATEARNHRIDRYTMVGIAISLAGVAVAVLGLVNSA